MSETLMSSREDEEIEFQELASSNEEADEEEIMTDDKRRRRRSEHVDEPDESPSPGKLVQYALFGSGFLPTTGTVQTLTPGVYHLESSQSGIFFVPHKIVTDKLLRLPDSRSDEVITEIERFWPLKERFDAFGFTHKRGILLWGPPGSGKTATVAFIIKQTVDEGGVVLLTDNAHPASVGSMLAKLREIEPDRRLVVVLEDIDTIIENYGESEVLSMLDGEASINNVVFLATTNYPENLDGRVVNRPSRFDRVIKIGMPSLAARKQYLQSRSLPPEVDVEAWASATEGFSIAHIKELIVSVCCYGNSFNAEVARLKRMFSRPRSNDTKEIGFDSGSSDL